MSDTLDAIVKRLKATEAKTTQLRQFLYQSLIDLEIEQSEIRQQCENEIRARAHAVADKRQIDVVEQDGDRVLTRRGIQGHDHILPQNLIRTSRELKMPLMEREGDNRDTNRFTSGQDDVENESRTSASPSPVLVPLLSGIVEGRNLLGSMLKPIAVAGLGGESRVQAHGHADQPPTLQQRYPPRLPPHLFASTNNTFLDYNISSYPPEFKREGPDWFALFNRSSKVKRVLDVDLVHTLMHESKVYCIKFSQDGKWLATGCHTTARIFDAQTGVNLCVLDHRGYDAKNQDSDVHVKDVCFSPDGKYLATVTEPCDSNMRVVVIVWDIAIGRIDRTFEAPIEFRSFRFSSYGLLLSYLGRTVRLWDVQNGTFKLLTIDAHYLPGQHWMDVVWSVALSPDKKYLAVGSLTGVVNILDVTTGVTMRRLRGHRGGVFCVAFTPDGKGLISGSMDKTLKYWDVSALDIRSGAHTLMNLTNHQDFVYSVVVSPDGAWIVSASVDKIFFWDARTGVPQCMLSEAWPYIDFSPAGNLFAVKSAKRVRIWRYEVVR